jgi:hypothetical protein
MRVRLMQLMKQPLEYWDQLKAERPQDLEDVLTVISAQHDFDDEGKYSWYGR